MILRKGEPKLKKFIFAWLGLAFLFFVLGSLYLFYKGGPLDDTLWVLAYSLFFSDLLFLYYVWEAGSFIIKHESERKKIFLYVFRKGIIVSALTAAPSLLIFASLFGSFFYVVVAVSIANRLFLYGFIFSLLFAGLAVYRSDFVFSKLGMRLVLTYTILILLGFALTIFYSPRVLYPNSSNNLVRLYVLSLGFPWLELFFSRSKNIFMSYTICFLINVGLFYLIGDLIQRKGRVLISKIYE